LFANLAASLITYEQIKTTLPKAKDLRPIVEKLITLGKRGDLHARRQAHAVLRNDEVVKKLFDAIAKRWRHGADGRDRADRPRPRRQAEGAEVGRSRGRRRRGLTL
jgi:large subunit ribosomal protein L17